MFNKNLYIVYDKVAQTCIGQIIQELTDGPAIRAFNDALRAENSLLAQHPADFKLLDIGTIDLETGNITPGDSITIATGEQWLAMQNSLGDKDNG